MARVRFRAASIEASLQPPSFTTPPQQDAPAPVAGAAVGDSARPELAAVRDAIQTVADFVEAKSGTGALEQKLLAVLSPTLHWTNELFAVTSRAEAIAELKRFRDFFLEARLQAEPPRIRESTEFSENESAGAAAVDIEWTLSGTWPLPWRPRVVLSAVSTIALEPLGGALMLSCIEDAWAQRPWRIVRQAAPRFGDVYGLYFSPHAEITTSTRRVLSTVPDGMYALCEDPAGEEVRAKLSKEDVSDEWFATPTAAPDAFAGRIKRAELYSAVAPVSVSRHGEDYDWRVGVPTQLRGGGRCRVGSNADVVRHGKRRVAVSRRFGGMATSTRAFEKAAALVARLRKDGLLAGDPADDVGIEKVIRSRAVRVATYDVKAGFNSRGELAILAFISHYFQLRRNEIWVMLDVDDAQLAEQLVAPPEPLGPDVDGDAEEVRAENEERRILSEVLEDTSASPEPPEDDGLPNLKQD